jgi:hypothetical protein
MKSRLRLEIASFAIKIKYFLAGTFDILPNIENNPPIPDIVTALRTHFRYNVAL